MNKPINLILIVLSIGLFYTWTSPQYDKIKALRVTASDYQNVIDNAVRISEDRDRLLVDYNTIPRVEIEKLTKVLPDYIDTVGLAVDLDTIASRYGISIKDVAVKSETDKNSRLVALPDYANPYGEVVVSFSFVSNYQNFSRFLNDLERSLKIMDVQSVSFKTSDVSNLYEHRFTVKTYWLK